MLNDHTRCLLVAACCSLALLAGCQSPATATKTADTRATVTGARTAPAQSANGNATLGAGPADARGPDRAAANGNAASTEPRSSAANAPGANPNANSESTSTTTTAAAATPPPRIGGIGGDLLLVNRETLTAGDILYPLRKRLAAIRKAPDPRGALERAVLQQTQEEVGAILLHDDAIESLNDAQREALDKIVTRELDTRISREFGGSRAKLDRHLAAHGMDFERYKAAIRRRMVVQNYAAEVFTPQLNPRRDELRSYFEARRSEFETPESRELLLIEAPFDQFLPEGASWDSASNMVQARARLAAKQNIDRAHEALARRSFADVAREMSRGPHAINGGLFGSIVQPLEPPYDEISRRVFDLPAGGHTGPIEGPAGWYLVGCGRIEPAKRPAFADVQDEIRDKFREDRLNQLASQHLTRLARRAYIEGLERFVISSVEMALSGAWPPASDSAR